MENHVDITVEKWKLHWDNKKNIDSEIELNGYNIATGPLSKEVVHAAVIEPILQTLKLQPNHIFLEIGCGSGLILREVENIVETCIGMDQSKTMIERFSGKSKILYSCAHNIPFENETFDRILMNSVAHYFPSLDYFCIVVNSALKALKHDGIFMIGDMLFDNQRKDSDFLFYNKHEVIDFLDSLGYSYSILAQNAIKRNINKRSDIVIYKD